MTTITHTAPDNPNIIQRVEDYLKSYLDFIDPAYSLPVALWIAATHCYAAFDAFPYMVITSATKQSGKTRLMECIGFTCHNAMANAIISESALFRSISESMPTILLDEAEGLSSEAASEMRSILNSGYRRGSVVTKTIGGKPVSFDTYGPKVFVLIGDVYDTLRDRSIIVTMRRGEAVKRFLYSVAQQEGEVLREELKMMFQQTEDEQGEYRGVISQMYNDFPGLPFLRDRDEEIWTPLFVIAQILCPSRIKELTRVAVDMSADKTGDARKYFASKFDEAEVEASQYAVQLLRDMLTIMEEKKSTAGGKRAPNQKVVVAMTTQEAIDRLKAIPEGPWRRYKGLGLDGRALSALLGRFGVKATTVRLFTGDEPHRGYDYDSVVRARVHLPVLPPVKIAAMSAPAPPPPIPAKSDGFCYCTTGKPAKHKPGTRGCHFKSVAEFERSLQ